MKIPYGKSFLSFEEAECAVLQSRIGELKAEADGLEIVRQAMENPIDSPRLYELAKGKKTCTIIISDHTRPVPSKDILPNMLKELREGNPEIAVTLLVATGFHRLSTEAELEAKVGKDIMASCRIAVHDCRDANANVSIGTLPSGAPLVLDRLAVETDLLIAEGFIEPHFFAGFSGGRKSVLPGVCDQITVLGNHCSRFIDSAYSRTGILDGNPIHADMVAAAEMAKLSYIVNVVIDEEKWTVAAFAGNPITAHRAGCDFLLSYAQVSPIFSDIVITSNGGAPLDQNLYQCVKGMTAAEATCREGGTIILCAECADGHGGEGFYNALKDCASPEALYAEQMATPQDKTVPDQWESQILARILMHYRVIMVSRPEMKQIVEDMKMIYASSVEEAVSLARSFGGKSITVIPNGISVIVR
ncbi:MAG: nickel-dependent lactate racemase [Anaerolineaceae bacterium]|nr:nickel-dependent lactate racemase [Oscillospiraceae bacterium]MBQ6481587.1 nickel-dependent lactate racemase [Anaerolineaceae bacterium]